MRVVIAFAVIATVAFLLWWGHDVNSEASTAATARPSQPRANAEMAPRAPHEPRLPSTRDERDTVVTRDEVDEPSASPSMPAAPLTPAAEIRRIESELAASGPATGAAWESNGYDQMQAYVRELASSHASASVTDYTCHADGCAAEITFATADDYSAARESLISGPAMRAWPGPRIVSPSEPGQGRPRVLVVLAKPPL
jgi:uncharacterized iron-regulated membrane protein